MYVAQVGLEALLVAERQHVDEPKLCFVDAVQPAVEVAGAELGRPGVACAGEEEFVAAGLAAELDVAAAAVEGGHFLVIRGVALVDAVELAEVQGQAVDLLALQPGAAIGLRQQAAVVAHHHRQDGLQGADVQGGGGQFGLGRHTGGAVVVLGTVGASRSLCRMPVPTRSGLESSFTPSRPMASTPKPIGPSV